ncbi:MAG: DUF4358 domain-containing protein [Clostridiales bacterium]|nr:DUF4358 domain-containing protein [Clostridiales bacterium]
MKKYLKLIPLLVILILAGCGKKDEIVSSELSQALIDANLFCEQLTVIDNDNAEKRYSLNSKDYSELTAAVGTVSTCDEFAIIKTGNTDAVVKDINEYLELKRERYEKYRPDETYKLNAPIIEVYNDAVMLIVTSDTDRAMKVYQEYLKKG